MTDLYKVTEVEGKGLGCIALKDIKMGSLILKEKFQWTAKKMQDPDDDSDFHEWVKSIVTSYQKLSSSDKKEYLKLYRIVPEKGEASKMLAPFKNHMNHMNESLTLSDYRDFAIEKEKIKEILQIYITNCVALWSGIGIKTSRFNHSCHSNAGMFPAAVEEDTFEIRAISKIKAGDEITFNYAYMVLSMQNKKFRQKYLGYFNGFKCYCDSCKKGADDNEEAYEAFQALRQEVEKLVETSDYKKPDLDLIKKQVFLYKEMYKLAKEKKAHRHFIDDEIICKGYQAANYGYSLSMDSNLKDEFKKECENFSNVGNHLRKKHMYYVQKL